MKTIFFVLTLGAVFFGGCVGRQALVHPDTDESLSIASIQKLKISSPVVAHGTMVEKCPMAGCWFMLHDRTGLIKVDLKATKQTVLNIPLNTKVTVHGKVMSNGSEKMIQAVSATF